MDEIGNAGLGGGAGNGAGAEHMQRFEILPAALIEHGDQVHHRLGPAQSAGKGGRIAHIGLNRMDLADATERLEMIGEVRAARGDANAPAVPGKRLNDMAAHESGASEYGDDAPGLDQIIRHGRPLVHPADLLIVP